MVRKRDQIIYKLPDNMQVAAIGEEQRQQLMKEIQALHQATMAAAASAQQKQQQDIKPIAHEIHPLNQQLLKLMLLKKPHVN
jgi:BRCT domain type II-containing protein